MSRTRRALAVAVVALAVIAVPGVAEAHDPIIVDDSQTTPDTGPFLPDGTISFALYGVVDGPGATRGFRVRFAEGDRLVLSLLVPDLPPEQTLPDAELPMLRIDAPDGTTRELEPDVRVAFGEPFSGTRYLRLLDLDEPATAGEYAITVIGRQPARFTVSVGTIERFGTPAEGVVDRAAGVAGVQAWYDTPPPEPAAPVPSTAATVIATSEPLPASAAPTTAPTTTAPTTPRPVTASTGGPVATTPDRGGTGGTAVVVGAALAAVAMAVEVTAVVRRRRRGG